MALLEREINARWPGGCIPYVIDQPLRADLATRNLIEEAMRWWSDACDLRFIPRTRQNRFVRFIPDELPMDGVCRSDSVGMSWQPTLIRLDPQTEVGVIAHEIGHAIGFYHEHQRPDRDRFVDMNSSQLNPIYMFNFGIKNDEMPVDGYDLDSIMHYGPAAGMSINGQTALITTDAPANAGRIGNRNQLSSGDIAAGNVLNRFSMHALQFNAGQVEKQVQQAAWANNWTSLSPFTLDARSFLFRYKSSDGNAAVVQINADGTFPRSIQNINLGAGWTSALTYTVGLRKMLLLYNGSTGDLELRGINGLSGQIDASAYARADWGTGWTSVIYYQAGWIGDYILFYNQDTGGCRVDNLNADGSLGQQKQFRNLSDGWNVLTVYKVGGRNYLFRLKTSTGSMVIRRIDNDGKVGRIHQEANWTSGWTMAHTYQSGGDHYLFLLKQGDGTVHINRIRSDGKIGAITDERIFSPGWKIGTTYGVGISPCAMMIRD
jgi:hypothetical protein